MTNNWNIPLLMETKIRKRDKLCFYCKKEFKANFKDRATFEHIDNDEFNISEKNICLCCASCNSSKGSKPLEIWLSSSYCKSKKIYPNNLTSLNFS